MLLPRVNNFRNNYGMSLFDEVFGDPFFSNFDMNPTMKTDIKEKGGSYYLDIDMPGFNKEDITAELKDGYLTISAQKDEKKDEKDEDGNYIRRERQLGQCSRSFFVGDGMKEGDIKASYKHGTLKLQIPKVEAKEIEDQKKYIEIQ